MNIVFLGLFIVVFVRLENVQTQISRMDSVVKLNSDVLPASKQGAHVTGSDTNDSSSLRPNATSPPTSSELVVPSTLLKVRRLVRE